VAVHSVTAAARWQQHGGCGRFAGTVRECADARTFKCHQRADVRLFVLDWRQRDNGGNGIVVGGGSDGSARGDVHRSRRWTAAADGNTADNAADDDTTNADGNADDILN
jgi:hypothetical protein